MKIQHVELKKERDSVILQAQCDIRYFGSDTIYFKVHKKFGDLIYNDASPFAAALLLPAMRKGENLIIEGAISEKLYHGMQECVKLLVSWNIKLQPIEIIASHLTKDSHEPQYIASFFSGGVDSFYTYLKHKNNTSEVVSHVILINGYDIHLNNKTLWKKTLSNVKEIAAIEDIALIEVESNARTLTDPICEWDHTYSACLGAVGLLLRNNIKKVYRASSYSYKDLIGERDMVIDSYFDTEKQSIIHDGAELNRGEKILAIAKSQLVLQHLRVCYENQKDEYNCGRCDKCLRTMISLLIAGKLADAKTFPKTIELAILKNLKIHSEAGAIFHRENLDELKKRNLAPEIQESIQLILKKISKKPDLFNHLMCRLEYFDHIYTRGRMKKLFGSPTGS